MDRLNTLWDNPELVEYWGHEAAPDPGRLDAILDYFDRTQQHDQRVCMISIAVLTLLSFFCFLLPFLSF